MDEEHLKEALHKLRQRQSQRGERWRFRVPKPWVPRIVALVRKLQQQGHSLAHVSRQLGIGQSTLQRWLAPPAVQAPDDKPALSQKKRLRPVVLAPALPPSERGALPSLSLRSPRGYEVLGLGLQDLAELLRRLE